MILIFTIFGLWLCLMVFDCNDMIRCSMCYWKLVSNGVCVVVMGIGNIFKIDDRYINIDRWSIIGDNCLLNVYLLTIINQIVFISRVWLTKVKIWIKLYHKFINYIIFPLVNINLEQNKRSFSICVAPDIHV